MKKKMLFLCIVSMLLFMSCAKKSADNDFDYKAFLALLTESGFSYVEEELDSTLNFLSVARRPLFIGDEVISVYEYESNQKMEKDSKYVDKNGLGISRPGNGVRISWISTPYFFKKGRLIVNYVGKDEQILNFLTEHLGSEFAGGRYAN